MHCVEYIMLLPVTFGDR